jgi:hypothetical protein
MPEPAPAHPPLNLTLPPRTSPSAGAPGVRDQALNDTRIQQPPPSASERFAQTLGTDTRGQEKQMANGLQLRQGTKCVLVRDNRITGVDPYSQSTRPVPRMTQPCS